MLTRGCSKLGEEEGGKKTGAVPQGDTAGSQPAASSAKPPTDQALPAAASSSPGGRGLRYKGWPLSDTMLGLAKPGRTPPAALQQAGPATVLRQGRQRAASPAAGPRRVHSPPCPSVQAAALEETLLIIPKAFSHSCSWLGRILAQAEGTAWAEHSCLGMHGHPHRPRHGGKTTLNHSH